MNRTNRNITSVVIGALFAVLIFVLMISAAQATNPLPPKPEVVKHGSKSNASANAHSRSRAVARGGHATGGQSSADQTQQQTQTANGGAGGSSNQTQSANNAGNAQNTSIATSVEDRLQAPSISAPAVYASGPCAYGWSAGLAIPGGGLSGGKSKPDANCDRRELARVLTPLNPYLALKILCADPIAAAVATEDDCLFVRTHTLSRTDQTQGTSPSAPEDQPATKREVHEAIDRVFKKTVSK